MPRRRLTLEETVDEPERAGGGTAKAARATSPSRAGGSRMTSSGNVAATASDGPAKITAVMATPPLPPGLAGPADGSDAGAAPGPER